MISFEHTIKNPVGFHAKPARELTELLKTMDLKVHICTKEKCVDASKLIRVISLGLVSGTTFTVQIEGKDEEKYLDQLRDFFAKNV